MLKIYMTEAPNKKLTYDQLKPLESNHCKLPSEMRTKGGESSHYHFNRWHNAYIDYPTNIVDYYKECARSESDIYIKDVYEELVDGIGFYIDKNYIFTEPFLDIPRVYQYRWELSNEAREILGL